MIAVYFPAYSANLNIALFNSPLGICIIVFTTSRQWHCTSGPEMNKFLIGKSWRSQMKLFLLNSQENIFYDIFAAFVWLTGIKEIEH